MRSQTEENIKNNLNRTGNDKNRPGNNPTPKQRGELIVKRLENFIREGRSDNSGISFRRWQEMAVHEFTNAILDAERDDQNDYQFMTRVIAVGALAIITIGFWGAIVAAGVSYDRQLTAFILIGAGGLLFLVFGLWPLKNGESINLYLISSSLIFLFLGLMNSRILSPLNNIWVKFGKILGMIIAPIVMALVYFVFLTPISLIVRIFGKDLLGLKFNKKQDTYWIERKKKLGSMKKQF